MSDHPTPDESGKDRAWLSIFVIAGALLLGALAWNEGRAAPRPRQFADPGPNGVLVLTDGQGILRGTVLVRGSGVVVVDGDGHERAYPWSQVHHVETDTTVLPDHALEGTTYKKRTPSAPRATQAAPRGRDGGTVILKSGDVHVGRIGIQERTVTVRWPYKGNTSKGQVSFPREDVRWFKLGVEGPTREYWRKFPNDHVTGHTNPLRRNDPLVVEAELAQNEGNWAEATRRWSDLYKTKGFRKVHLLNLETCAKNWIKSAGTIDASEAAARRLGDVYLAGLADRDGVRGLLGEIYLGLAQIGFNTGRNKSAREFALRLKGLGSKHAQHGEALLKRMRGE